MPFIPPMLASKKIPDILEPGQWMAEEKFDGHRLIVSVSDRPSTLFSERTVEAWSRNNLPRILPPHVREALSLLPNGTYDGELMVPGARSYGTVELTRAHELVYMMFDVIELLGRYTPDLGATYLERRSMLHEISSSSHFCEGNPVRIAESHDVLNTDSMFTMVEEVWARDGEGLIVKRKDSIYQPGKRPKSWFKVKGLKTGVLKIVGYMDGTMGENSRIVLQDKEGFQTSIKWKNYKLLDQIQADPDGHIGRSVQIKYQERTPDGKYRHPRWDCWAEKNQW